MNIFQLFGEIAIDNSKANEQIDKTAKGAKKLASTMKSAFATAGKAAVKAGKVIAAGVAAGTAAMSKLAADAMSAYADYEQLEGGVKKLFGDEAQQLVMEYAKNAYKTAGLSANEYMETVTSFSASLIAGLGNDTVAAAQYADIAITDMADNANTFGTSMEDIQNAYKGFSKQNYTMLDNLKLGYGGTQKEMERLLKDAQALSGVKYDIKNFSDIIAAIHVIQEQQNIAGTTANEAATTISGSLGMVKGAWKNLLSGLADGEQDIGKLVGNLSDSVLTAMENIVPRLQTMAPRLVEAVRTLVSTLGPQLPGIINSVLPGLVEAATTLIVGLADVLPDLLGALIDVLPTVFAQIGGAMQKLFPALGKSIQNILGKINFNGLGQAIGNGLKSIVTNLPNILSSIGNAISNGWSTIVWPLIQGLFSAVFGIELPTWSKVAGDITNLWNDVQTAIAGFFEWLFNLKLPTWEEVKSDIETVWNNVKTAIAGFFEWLFNVKMPTWEEVRNDITDVWNNVKTAITGFFEWLFNVKMPTWEEVRDDITDVWNNVTTAIGEGLSIMWKLLNPLNIARQVRNAWNTATSGLNLTVGWTIVQKTVSSLSNPAENPINPESNYQQIISTDEGKNAVRQGWGALFNSIVNPSAHAAGAVFSKPTLFDTASGYHLVGEAGAEAVAPISVLQGYVKSAVNEVVGANMERKLDQMLTALQDGFGGMNQQIVLDTGVLVGSTAGMMDKRLGRMAARKGRNA